MFPAFLRETKNFKYVFKEDVEKKIHKQNSLMMSSLLSPSCPRIVSLRTNQADIQNMNIIHVLVLDNLHVLGIDEDDEHEKEDEERVGLLEVGVP